jgi:hypothetical protein
MTLHLPQRAEGPVCYSSYDGMFNSSGQSGTCWAPGTSVRELVMLGIFSEWIVVGKPVSLTDAGSGYTPPVELAAWIARAATDPSIHWSAGVFGWQYSAMSAVWLQALYPGRQCSSVLHTSSPDAGVSNCSKVNSQGLADMPTTSVTQAVTASMTVSPTSRTANHSVTSSTARTASFSPNRTGINSDLTDRTRSYNASSSSSPTSSCSLSSTSSRNSSGSTRPSQATDSRTHETSAVSTESRSKQPLGSVTASALEPHSSSASTADLMPRAESGEPGKNVREICRSQGVAVLCALVGAFAALLL